MRQFILREGVLNDNTLTLADEGKVFKGNYIAILKEYVFASAWHNTEVTTRFRNEKQLHKYLNKNYSETELEHVEL